MAKISYLQIEGVSESLFFKGLQPGDRFTNSRIVKKDVLLTRKRKKGLTVKSLLPQITALWNALTTGEKDDWNAAGAECDLTGFRLFVRDTSYRIINSISGFATPSLLHQSLVGQIHIESPATECKIEQLHPRTYYVYRKITGTKSQYNPVVVTENFVLPLTISLNYKTALTSAGSGAFAKMIGTIWHSYQGVDRFTNVEISLPLSHDWQHLSASISSVIGQVVGYTLFIHLFNVTGDLFFDNIKSEHSGQNWLRDPFCNNINQEFTKQFQQIPKHWDPVILPDGATFESVYPAD